MNRKEPYIGMPIILGDFETATRSNPQPLSDRMQMPPQSQPQMSQQGGGRETEMGENPQPPQMQNRQPMVVGMAYVPWQRWQKPYEYEEGWRTGTIFSDLNLPFLGDQGGRRG